MANSRTGFFRYDQARLARREIRLLHVLCGGGSGALRCEIHYANLDSPPPYEALSYTWGETTLKTNILCNRKSMTVTRNLAIALRALRYVNRTRVLWVDAVCINQKDHVEKGQQIRMMRHIYRRAARVVAWVGEEDPKDRAALDVDKYLDISSEDRLSFKEVETWVSLTTFIKRPWFSRVWIVQELAVAKELTIYCGQREIEWDVLRSGLFKFLDRMGLYLNTSKAELSLERVFTLLSIRNLVTEHCEEQQEPQGYFYRYQLFRIDDERKSMKVKAGDLLHFVKGTRLFGSTEPSDHIFALLGLVLRGEREEIVIDYSQPYADVYREFVRVMIVQHGTLDVLSQAGLHRTLPSWVPDWTRQMKSYPLTLREYSASGKTRANEVNFRGQRMLTLRGVVFDTIARLTPGFIVYDTAESEVFEPRLLKTLRVLSPVVAIAKGKNPVNAFKAIPTARQISPVRMTRELEEQWYEAAQPDERASSSGEDWESASSSGEDWELAYMQTLIGDLPFEQLGTSDEALVHECYRIWLERLNGRVKIKPTSIKVSRELMKLFPRHQDFWLSEVIERMKEEFEVEYNFSTDYFRMVDISLHHYFSTEDPIILNDIVNYARSGVKQYIKSTLGLDDNTPWTADIRRDERSDLIHDNESVKWGIARMFSRAVERMACNRQFCTTRKGYMGWVPFEARIEKGDVVCVLEGGRVPYILRPEVGWKGRYRFVGEAYIHGLMDGEGWVGKMEKISLV